MSEGLAPMDICPPRTVLAAVPVGTRPVGGPPGYEASFGRLRRFVPTRRPMCRGGRSVTSVAAAERASLRVAAARTRAGVSAPPAGSPAGARCRRRRTALRRTASGSDREATRLPRNGCVPCRRSRGFVRSVPWLHEGRVLPSAMPIPCQSRPPGAPDPKTGSFRAYRRVPARHPSRRVPAGENALPRPRQILPGTRLTR